MEALECRHTLLVCQCADPDHRRSGRVVLACRYLCRLVPSDDFSMCTVLYAMHYGTRTASSGHVIDGPHHRLPPRVPPRPRQPHQPQRP